MKYTFGKITSVYGDWRDWFIVDDQSQQKYTFDFYVNTTFIGSQLIPIPEDNSDVIVEIIGECISTITKIWTVRYVCKELNKESSTNVDPGPRILHPGDSVNIQFRLQFDIEEVI